VSSVTYLEFNAFSSKHRCNRAGINVQCKTEHRALRVHEGSWSRGAAIPRWPKHTLLRSLSEQGQSRGSHRYLQNYFPWFFPKSLLSFLSVPCSHTWSVLTSKGPLSEPQEGPVWWLFGHISTVTQRC